VPQRPAAVAAFVAEHELVAIGVELRARRVLIESGERLVRSLPLSSIGVGLAGFLSQQQRMESIRSSPPATLPATR